MGPIRAATIHDLPGTYRVCLLTGDSGRDATSLFRNPDLLGHVYVGPYICGQLEFAFVLADDDGIAGYCVGALDTRDFAAWREAHWWPALREQYSPRDDGSADARAIRLIHAPAVTPQDIVAEYPSHLHIDLLERVRGRGAGRALIQRLLEELGTAGSRGVHLEVGAGNANAIAFYRHVGFVDLMATDDSLFLGRRLA